MVEIDGPLLWWKVHYRAPNGRIHAAEYVTYRSQSDLDAAMSTAATRGDILVWRKKPVIKPVIKKWRGKDLFYARCAFIPAGSELVEPPTQANVAAGQA